MKKISIFLMAIFFMGMFLLPCYGEEDVFINEFIGGPEGEYLPGEILVDFKDDTTEGEIESFKEKYNLESLTLNSEYSQKELLMRATVEGKDIDALIDLLSTDPEIEYAEPDYIYYAYSSQPNDPLYKYQWHMDQIKVRNAWDITAGEEVIVAVIDTGVSYTDHDRFHKAEDLNNTLFVKGYDFVNDNPYACDDNCHGTHVAGTIAQSTYNGKGVVGIAYNCKIMPLKVLSAQGFGSVADIADAIRFAADNGAKVINMSLGGPFSSKVMADACKYAYSKGVTIICAAGNSRSTRIGYPAGYPECIAVSAVRYDKELTFYSNRGKNIDIAAPGGDLRVDQNGDGKKDGVLQNTIARMNPAVDDYYLFQGTSMASPHVAGVAALIESLGVTNPPAVEEVLKASANRDVPADLDTGYGAGVVDAHKAVLHAALLRGYVKLILGLLFMVGFLYLIKFKFNISLPFSLWFFPGTIIGACGLFFLPFFGVMGITPPILKTLLCSGFPQWDMAFFGINSHQHPLFYSALCPLLLALPLLLLRINFLRKFVIGFTMGVAAHLFYAALSSDAVMMVWIPKEMGSIFLHANVALCIYIAWELAGRIFKKQPQEA